MDLNLLRLSDAPPKECLEAALAHVDKRRQDAVKRVLYTAKVEKILGELPGRQIKYVRTLRYDLKPAAYHLKRLKRHGHGITIPDDVIRIADVVKKLDIPDRRKTEGRHVQPWIKKARLEMDRLKIKKDAQEELLLACGIRKPRSNDEVIKLGRLPKFFAS